MTLSVLAVALIGPSSAHAAAWLTPPEPISTAGAPAAGPPLDVAVDPAKDVFIAWERPAVVQVGVRPAGGSFAVASLYGCPFGFFCTSARQPDVAVDAGGNSIVVFTLDGRLKAFMRPAGGSYTELPAITSATNVQAPKLAFAPDGTAIAVWRQEDVGLFAAERPPGGSFGTPIPIFTEAGGEEVTSYDLATGGTAHAMVAFATDTVSGNNNTARVRTVFRAPVGWGAAQLVAEESATSQPDCSESVGVSPPAVALDGDADAVVGFQVHRSQTGTAPECSPIPTTKVVADRRMVDLGTWGVPPTTFDGDSGSGFNRAPATAFASSGEALLAWVRSEGDTTVIREAAGPAGGSTFGGAEDVPGSALTDSNGTLGDPELVALPGGAAMLGFVRQATTNASVEYALRPAGGPFGAASTAADRAVANNLKLAASPAGDVGATWLEQTSAAEARVYSLTYDASPPSFGDATVPATGVVGQALPMSATATDAFSPVTFAWAFGDGATGTGAATTHAYGAAGSFAVTVTATDAAGNASTATRSIAIAVDENPEFLGGLLLANARLRAAARGPSAIATQRRRRRAPIGTRVTFRLSEAASVRFTVQRARPGRRVRGRCVKPTRKNRKRRKCTRYVRQRGSFTVQGAAGETRFRFTGRLRGRKLRPGRYRLVAVATDDTGRRSAPRRAKFAIVR